MAKKNSVLAAPSKALDPTLDALFASSAGPAKPPPKSRYVELLPHKSSESQELSKPEEDEGDEEDEEDGSVDDQLGDDDEDEDHSEEESGEEEDEATEILEAITDRPPTDRKRKRKNKDDDDELESKYLQKLVDNEEPSGKRQKGEAAQDTKEAADEVEDIDMSDSDGEIPVHESLAADAGADEVEKASRTVYLSNVSIEAIKSAKAKKVLLAHLESILDSTSSRPQTIESIRFRSLPFATAKLPKRAAYIKKSLMDATTKAANAYVVYSDAAGCRAACSKLNGTMVLDRHLRVDSVAHPAAVDHRRCVFVGNLGFVDDEAVLNTTVDEEGEEVTEKRKRTKAPMDVEEGLWRVFGKQAGKVENVRVVRDPVTRVGKGFAYVQFYDGTSVEAALLLAGKKFPPMLPRELRVTRCRAPQKTARALEIKGQRTSIASDKKKSTKYVPKPTAESQTLAGRAGKLFGRSGAVRLKGRPGRDAKRPRPNREQNGDASSAALKTPEQIVFEGRRASAKDGKPRDLKFKGSKAGGQKKSSKKNHATQRTQKWKSKQAEKK